MAEVELTVHTLIVVPRLADKNRMVQALCLAPGGNRQQTIRGINLECFHGHGAPSPSNSNRSYAVTVSMSPNSFYQVARIKKLCRHVKYEVMLLVRSMLSHGDLHGAGVSRAKTDRIMYVDGPSHFSDLIGMQLPADQRGHLQSAFSSQGVIEDMPLSVLLHRGRDRVRPEPDIDMTRPDIDLTVSSVGVVPGAVLVSDGSTYAVITGVGGGSGLFSRGPEPIRRGPVDALVDHARVMYPNFAISSSVRTASASVRSGRGRSARERIRRRKAQEELERQVAELDRLARNNEQAKQMMAPRKVEEVEAQAVSADNNTCIICLTSHITTMLLPCTHMTFCKPCITTWLKATNKCPTCKTEVKRQIQPRMLYTLEKEEKGSPAKKQKISDPTPGGGEGGSEVIALE